MKATSAGTHGGREGTILAAAMAVVVLSGCTETGVTPATAPPESPRPSPASTTRPAQPGREVAAPARIRIPSIRVSAPIIALSIDRTGKLAAPKAFNVAGWNEAGPEPGEAGTAVIAGHVDSRNGPAVFFRLRDLRAGDRVDVERVDGGKAGFVVTRVARYPKSSVPAAVYRPARNPELRLVTCGGTFDQTRRSYRDNIVVYAVQR
jgi:sortase (surface protein transpeptidase)